jgi:hypothetical protein
MTAIKGNAAANYENGYMFWGSRDGRRACVFLPEIIMGGDFEISNTIFESLRTAPYARSRCLRIL